eukprot:SAG31_NODE_916_length_11047_cov_3.507033_7_plen_35_part_00
MHLEMDALQMNEKYGRRLVTQVVVDIIFKNKPLR